MKKRKDYKTEMKVSDYEQAILKHKFGKIKVKRPLHFLHYVVLVIFSSYLIIGFQGLTEKVFTYGYTAYEKYQYQKVKKDFISMGKSVPMVYQRHLNPEKQNFSITVDKMTENDGDYQFQFSIHNQSDYPLILNQALDDQEIMFSQGGQKTKVNLYPSDNDEFPVFEEMMIMPGQVGKAYGNVYDKKMKAGSYLLVGDKKVDVYQKANHPAKTQKNNQSFDVSDSPYDESDLIPKKRTYSVNDTVHFKDDSIKRKVDYDPKREGPKDYKVRLKNVHQVKASELGELDKDNLKMYQMIGLELEVQNLSNKLLKLPYADRILYSKWEPGVYISANTEEFELEIPAKSTESYQYNIYVPNKKDKQINLCLFLAKDYIKDSDTNYSVYYGDPFIQNLVPLQWKISIPQEKEK